MYVALVVCRCRSGVAYVCDVTHTKTIKHYRGGVDHATLLCSFKKSYMTERVNNGN